MGLALLDKYNSTAFLIREVNCVVLAVPNWDSGRRITKMNRGNGCKRGVVPRIAFY